MNINNSLPIVYSNPNIKSRSVESAESDKIRISRNNSHQKENLANQQRESVRVIRVATDGLKIAEFGSKFQSPTSGRLSSLEKPELQYQANQGLLVREEIGELVGVDLFA